MQMKYHPRSVTSVRRPLFAMLLMLLLLTACGGGEDRASESDTGNDSDRAGQSEQAVPTMPVAQFAQPTTMIDPTKVAEAEGVATPASTVEPDMALGADAYEDLCAECHGADGNGNGDKGGAVAGIEIELAVLVDLLRTGNGLGSEHIFGPSKISDDGIAALHAYMQTLPTP